MPKRKRGITGDAASRREAIRKRERTVVETEEERNSRLSDMAQRGQERRAEETEERRNRRLAVMAQRGQMRRAEETEEQKIVYCQTRHNVARREESKKQKNKEIADWQ
ncbi:hypothetical protein AVEN_189170-1 [Araneus ventricosus]|uniref:STPR domain-containing protein n=1 Tax=Araneus ventricosus TaxID=182803 RepID=A0A4Y2HNR5_ARAVE|nr:hypothetical protein AVEN_189170-1 [Araneus ventricosus]